MNVSLNTEQYLKDLEYLVNIDSQSKDTEGVAKIGAFFEKAFAEIGWSVEKKELDPSVAPSLKFTNGKPPYDAFLLGHLDTVFPKGTVSERPFSRDEKRAYGPGVNDMKSGLLFGLYAARALTEAKAKGSFCIVYNSEEEIGSRHARCHPGTGTAQRQPDERTEGAGAYRGHVQRQGRPCGRGTGEGRKRR